LVVHNRLPDTLSPVICPATLDELRDAVLSAPRVLAVGAQTKPRLSAMDAVKISTRQLRGIVEYDPSEFTFTALAGTPVHEIVAALAERGQYLPFDPMLVEAGSTIGGVIASGLSGPGRFRYGGVRDFILGVRFVDGLGRLLRMGGKVVKNAAGFDVPKFLVGSLGRFGAIGEVTFKVFPRPASTLTLEVAAEVKTLTQAAGARWELHALDVLPGGEKIVMRLGGPAVALEALAREILAKFPGEIVADTVWDELREFRWADPGAVLVKTPITPEQAPLFRRAHVSCGGNVAYSCEPVNGLTLRGDAPLWIGTRPHSAIEAAVKSALDPQGRFQGEGVPSPRVDPRGGGAPAP
jgi:glycolate oxidase FAD binding subunit